MHRRLPDLDHVEGIAKSLSLWAVKLDSSLIDRSKGNLDLEEIVEYEGILKESYDEHMCDYGWVASVSFSYHLSTSIRDTLIYLWGMSDTEV